MNQNVDDYEEDLAAVNEYCYDVEGEYQWLEYVNFGGIDE